MTSSMEEELEKASWRVEGAVKRRAVH